VPGAYDRTVTRSRSHPRAVRDGLIVAGLLFAAYLFVGVAPATGTFGFDAYAYWSLDLADPYPRTAGGLGAFTYTPVAARAFAPASLLPWPAFLWLWTAVLVGTVIWLGWRWWFAVLAFPPVALELYHGNIHLLMAAAIALGFRYPAAWWFVVLTKVTPGIAIAWFLVRREWRSLAVAAGGSAAIAATSFALDRPLWDGWIASVTATATGSPLNQFSLGIPLVARMAVALALVAWGGLTDRAWTVPVAATLALPVLWPSGFAVLAALWPIVQRRPALRIPGAAQRPRERAGAYTTRGSALNRPEATPVSGPGSH